LAQLPAYLNGDNYQKTEGKYSISDDNVVDGQVTILTKGNSIWQIFLELKIKQPDDIEKFTKVFGATSIT